MFIDCEGSSSGGFSHPSHCFSPYSKSFWLRPSGILVLIRSNLSMTFQIFVQVVVERAKNSYRG